jgi:RimJ/RimL family protein N-acetyltransferase
MVIRQVLPSDAEKLSSLVYEVENESKYMLYEPRERKISPEKQLKMIEAFLIEKNSTIFVAELDDRLIGYLFAIGGSAERNQHSLYLVIGIIKEYQGIGVGTQLFTEMEAWAVIAGHHRIELTVMTDNKAGLALYRKSGFEIEGTKRHSLLVNGQYKDEYYMSKLL